MITVTRLDSTSILLNSDLIETVETTPDTVIRLVNGQKIVVLERVQQILERVQDFRRSTVWPPCGTEAKPARSSPGTSR